MTKEAKREYARKRYQANREKILKQRKQYYQDNAEKVKEYRKENAEYYKEYNKQYRKDNAEQIKEYNKQYNKTPMGRASNLLTNYNQNDKKYNRGECTLTAKWIVDNIFTKPCHYCGKEGWKVIGCDRIDNSLPHTEDNVVPCCEKCNTKRGTMNYYEFIKKMGLTSPS